MKTSGVDLESLISEFHNNSLGTENDDPNNNVGGVVKDTLEDVDLVIYHSAVNHVENLHNHKYIEHI